MTKYLFIRILEACNAGCFMCDFRKSEDSFRLSLNEYKEIVIFNKERGLKYIRFTGGEPLKHSDILDFIDFANKLGIKTSIITNGYYLPEMAKQLRDKGLDQVIVSIDGASDKTHDRFRNTKGLFNKCIEGIKLCNDLNIKTRVNTVAGPHNYSELVNIQELLTQLNVQQWELSALKLVNKIKYPNEMRNKIIRDLDTIYNHNSENKLLNPMGGVYWCGRNDYEQIQFFENNVPPKPQKRCELVNNMRYYDAKNKYLFPCSLLPHREDNHQTCTKIENISDFHGKSIKGVSEHYHVNGPEICKGCSSTAAGYKNTGMDWDF